MVTVCERRRRKAKRKGEKKRKSSKACELQEKTLSSFSLSSSLSLCFSLFFFFCTDVREKKSESCRYTFTSQQQRKRRLTFVLRCVFGEQRKGSIQGEKRRKERSLLHMLPRYWRATEEVQVFVSVLIVLHCTSDVVSVSHAARYHANRATQHSHCSYPTGKGFSIIIEGFTFRDQCKRKVVVNGVAVMNESQKKQKIEKNEAQPHHAERNIQCLSVCGL